MPSSDIRCDQCDKTYKTTTGLQRHIQTKHLPITIQPQPEAKLQRKRKNHSTIIEESDEDYIPLLKL